MISRFCNIFAIIIVSVLLGWMLAAGYYYQPCPPPKILRGPCPPPMIPLPDCPIDLEVAQARMEEGRDNHQVYADNASICNETSGNVSHNLEWVETYDDMLALIEWAKVR